ncbi:putative bifunctional diguanylate cyclase/phosphodiesterase [Imhoffiella purpurea]|uniref:cyclic-guanylate-specific phosphodiesterase n=1 Tax=Imhoffiella purpurea TaxID=1249627 RepID=W9VFY1_9GAMM|nr:EAL domain-containing protein [Imhoffiella purpurea]EXJ14942.1 diguanylate cyclase [Imhoffiella purpurea]
MHLGPFDVRRPISVTRVSILLALPALIWLISGSLGDVWSGVPGMLRGLVQVAMAAFAATLAERAAVRVGLIGSSTRASWSLRIPLAAAFAVLLALAAGLDLTSWLLLSVYAASIVVLAAATGRSASRRRRTILLGLILLQIWVLALGLTYRMPGLAPFQPVVDLMMLVGLYWMLREASPKETEASGLRPRPSVECIERLIDHAPAGILIMDMDAGIRYVNRQFATMMGETDEPLAIANLLDLIPDASGRESLRRALAELGDCAEPESGSSVSLPLVGPDGRDVTTDMTLSCASIGGWPLVMAFVQDTSEQTRQTYLLHTMATQDDLTGLPNRSQLSQILADEQGLLVPGALALIDLDRFRQVNESLGHEFGDLLLVAVCARLVEILPPGTPLVRFSGDVLVAVLFGADRKSVVALSERILAAFSAPILINEWEHRQTLSLGIALIPSDGRDVSQLVRKADLALGWAKTSGGGSYAFYDGPVAEQVQRRHRLQGLLRVAIEEQEFHLHYQPRIDLLTRRITGWEALLRWNCRQEGAISPAEFIPVAEESGLILEIGDWVLQQALEQQASWLDQGLNPGTMAVNLSPRQLRRPDLAQRIATMLMRSGVEAGQLELEITETALMEDVQDAIRILNELNDMGVRLSVDDFGTGYSSLGYLRSFPLDRLKIDRSFVSPLGGDGGHHEAITRAIIVLAHSLGLSVVAEGVETEAQLRYLVLNDCEEVQGFLFSRPLPAEACERLLRDGRTLMVRSAEGT